MSEQVLRLAVDWLALALTLGVIAAALGAVTARSLFAMCMFILAAGAMAAAALLARGAGDAGLAAALLFCGLAPFLLLAALLLSARTAKPRRRGRPWLTIAAACFAAAAVLWALPDLGAPATVRIALTQPSPITLWLALIAFAGVAACVGLLGFGERGAFERLTLHNAIEPE
jgi:hypothetical protein